eukprot:scaffold1170_cov122-Cylindrotheca_fusiformis.AAC.21
MFLSLAKSARLYIFGGKPLCNSTDGSLSPTDEAKDRRIGDDARATMDRATMPALEREASIMVQYKRSTVYLDYVVSSLWGRNCCSGSSAAAAAYVFVSSSQDNKERCEFLGEKGAIEGGGS